MFQQTNTEHRLYLNDLSRSPCVHEYGVGLVRMCVCVCVWLSSHLLWTPVCQSKRFGMYVWVHSSGPGSYRRKPNTDISTFLLGCGCVYFHRLSRRARPSHSLVDLRVKSTYSRNNRSPPHRYRILYAYSYCMKDFHGTRRLMWYKVHAIGE